MKRKQFSQAIRHFYESKGNVLLFGAAGKTGYYYIQLLVKYHELVFVYDKNQTVLENLILELKEKRPEFMTKVQIVSDEQLKVDAFLEDVKGVTLSPGVSLALPFFEVVRRKCIFLFSELEYTMLFLHESYVIALTGTDGKSTTVSMIEHVMGRNNAIAIGNFGISCSQALVENLFENKVLIIELSSYQLELSRNLEVNIGIYLNIAADHLDRYPSFSHYYLTKWNLCEATFLKKGVWIYSNQLLYSSMVEKNVQHLVQELLSRHNQDGLMHICIEVERLASKHFYWNSYLSKDSSKLYELKYITQMGSSKNEKEFTLLDSLELKVFGKHNLLNILFVCEAIYVCLLQEKQLSAEEINNSLKQYMRTLTTFPGLPHRFEKFLEKDYNIYINDSKATTTQAVINALKNTDNMVYIFLGGQGKGESYEELALHIQKKKNVYILLFGAEREKLYQEFSKYNIDIEASVEFLQDAFCSAKEHQNKYRINKATFLLSPSCTSWDAYSSFEERGEHFKEIVFNYYKNK